MRIQNAFTMATILARLWDQGFVLIPPSTGTPFTNLFTL